MVYTSLTGDGDHFGFALAHRATEQMIKASGLGWTILRKGLYAELLGALLTWATDGLESAFGDGALSAVARIDLAAATAIVVSNPSVHSGRTYDLAGEPITATGVADRPGRCAPNYHARRYRAKLLADDALLPFEPPMLSSIATSVRHGFLSSTGPDLGQLLDRPLTDPLTVAMDTAAAMRPIA